MLQCGASEEILDKLVRQPIHKTRLQLDQVKKQAEEALQLLRQRLLQMQERPDSLIALEEWLRNAETRVARLTSMLDNYMNVGDTVMDIDRQLHILEAEMVGRTHSLQSVQQTMRDSDNPTGLEKCEQLKEGYIHYLNKSAEN